MTIKKIERISLKIKIKYMNFNELISHLIGLFLKKVNA